MIIPKNKPYRSKANFRKYAENHPDCEVTGKMAQDVHHIVFKSQGGGDEDQNLIALCREEHDKAHGPDARVMRELFKRLK